jgi:translation initiation factor IF-1
MSDTESVEVNLDDARAVMYDKIVEMLGGKAVKAQLENQMAAVVTHLYDRRDQLQQND